MPLWKNTQHAFIAGQLDANVMGRQDMDRYFKGATLLKNFLVKRQGCISKRRGTDLTADLDGLLGATYDGTPIVPDKMRLVPVTNGDDGRYLILSGGIGFVASREGVLTRDGRHVRKVAPYVALDEDGKATGVYGKDVRQSTETPVDVIHRISSGNYSVTRHATLQAAFDAAMDGDTVRLHSNLLLTGSVYVRSEAFTISDGIGTMAWDASYTDMYGEHRWKLTRGGQVFYPTKNGRYANEPTFDIGKTVTATKTWTFSDGGAWTISWAGGRWTITDGTNSYSTAGADTLETIDFSVNGATVTATMGWTFSDGGSYAVRYEWPNHYVTHPSYRINAIYTQTPNVNTLTFTCYVYATRAPKAVTLDLYGYKVTVRGNSGINIPNDTCKLTVDSARAGAEVVVLNGESRAFQLQQNKVLSGALTLDGDIHYATYDRACKIVYALNAEVTVNGGTFECLADYKNTNCTLLYVSGGTLTVNGGTFVNERTDGPGISLISIGYSSDDVKRAVTTVNGGTFVNRHVGRTGAAMYWSYAVNNTLTQLIVNGGRFDVPSPYNLFGSCGRRGGNYWRYAYLRIVRGEFSVDGIYDSYDSAVRPIDQYTGDVGDTTSPTATSVTFAMLGLTATSSAWTLSDASERLNFYWSEYGGTWNISGYDSQGRYVSESVGGTPADTEVAFRACGITATRTWTFSDDGSWPIGYSGGGWHVTTSVLNDAQPDADGFYGVKVAGEGDYSWDGAERAAVPYRFAIPYADADLADLCIRQSGDTLFIAHRDYPPAKIWFDRHGLAYFEELRLDNTDHLPPVIESAAMAGNAPQETDGWPAEFDTPPAWLDAAQKAAVTAFRNACRALGTVTDAGFSGNKADGSDGSCSYACSYTCTSVSVNRLTGKKTTTVSVKSFTKSVTKETTTTYTNGTPNDTITKTITTPGTAENSASATSVIVTRTVRYVATYVKDGRESRPSAPFAVDYDMPWANNAVVNITLGKGANTDEPDCYNVYKDNGNGYGLIATVGVDRIAGGVSGAVDTYPLFLPDNTKTSGALVCAADFEERKGWAVGDILRKMVSSGKDTFTSSPANDVCLITTAANASNGIKIDFPTKTRFDRIRLMLDGRIYDKETDASYIIVSSPAVTATVTYWKNDGTTGTISKSVSSAISYAYGGITGGWMEGIYADWVGLQYKRFTAPNGDMVYGWLYGKGDCTDDFNSHLRSLDIDLSAEFKNATGGFAGVKSIKFTFSTSVYSYWTNNQQGCFHAIHFYSGSSSANSGIVQDDYINPDMTVTPPDDTQDPHFSAADEYPGCVGIYEQRLVFASTRTSPSTIWMSRIADLYNFTAHDSIREDDALELTLAATEFPNINHLVMGRDLMLFGDGGEWLIAPVSGNALTYKTASAKLQSMIGSDRALQPLQLADETLFAERGGTCLRSINYSYTSDSYQSEDLSVIAQSVFRANPIVSMAYKQHPDSIVECVLKDGRVGTLVYMKEQEVAAWSVQELGGGWKAREIVTPKCIVNGTTEMMLLVEKDGVYQLWKVRDDDDTPVAASQVILDGMQTMARADADAIAEAIAAGEMTVDLGDGTYAVGYPVEAEFVSVRPEPERGQTAQMEIKNATEAELRVTDATTFSVKPYGASSGWREVSLPAVRDGASVALHSKDCKKLMTGSNNRDGRLHLKHVEPWPLTVLSVSTTYQVEYENGGNEQ